MNVSIPLQTLQKSKIIAMSRNRVSSGESSSCIQLEYTYTNITKSSSFVLSQSALVMKLKYFDSI